MRVLFVQGAGERGGAERVLLALMRYLPDHGITPAVATFADGPFLAEVAGKGIEVIQLAASPRAREIWRIPNAAREVGTAASKWEAHVIQANGEKMALYAGHGARRADVPSVFWLHDAPARSLASLGLQLLMKITPHAVAVAGSRWMSDEFRRRLRMNVEVIPHGIDLEILPTNPIRPGDWPPSSVIFGFFARLQSWKGCHVFLQAAAKTAIETPSAQFVVVGGPLYGWELDYARSLPRLAEELGIADRVAFLGHREDALEVMLGCDVVVHASLLPEPFGLVVLEALGLGRAVIATRTRGPQEVIVHQETGLLVEPGDVPALARAMTLLIDPQTRTRLADRGRNLVSEVWSAERMAEGFAFLYRRITD